MTRTTQVGWKSGLLAAALVGCGGDDGRRDTASAGAEGTGIDVTVSTSASTATPTTGAGASTSGQSASDSSDPTTSPTSVTTAPDTDSGASATTDGTTTGLVGCGDGVLADGEECDAGPGNGAGQACKSDCTLNVCGDGDVGPNEACDDGAGNGPDAPCSATCSAMLVPCVQTSFKAVTLSAPVDIVVAIDNSGSMGQEITAIQNTINASFAEQLDTAGLDYRVILVARYGKVNPDESVCIEAPLSGIPQGGCAAPPGKPVNNPDKFYHYSVEIGSSNVYSQLLSTYTIKDEFNLAPTGWREWMRAPALKSFLIFTDDNSGLSAASFETQLQAKDPIQFGATLEERRYDIHSICGVRAKDPPQLPYLPAEPTTNLQCPSAVNPGLVHQTLSINTGGLRFPVCNEGSFGEVFTAIADSVKKNVPISCTFPIDMFPDNALLVPENTVLKVSPGNGDPPYEMTYVPDPGACVPDGYYFDGPQIVLCPEACMTLQGDVDAVLDIGLYCMPG